MSYPKYIDYGRAKKAPSVLAQRFPVVEAGAEPADKLFYPKTEGVEDFFSTKEQSLRFGASRFCGFLHDTIGVEHNLVIPAVASAGLLRCPLPQRALEDLYKLVTDEGHHAAQAAIYMHSVANKFDVKVARERGNLPKFLRRLNAIKFGMSEAADRVLCDVLAGIVTETRISLELSVFATDPQLKDSVRDICASHQEDEAIHASQFRSLGRWLWEHLDEEKRSLAASLYAKITLARSLPDIDRLAFYLSETAAMSPQDARKIVEDTYTPEKMMSETLLAGKPTLNFLSSLGVTEMGSFKEAYAAYDWEVEMDRDFNI